MNTECLTQEAQSEPEHSVHSHRNCCPKSTVTSQHKLWRPGLYNAFQNVDILGSPCLYMHMLLFVQLFKHNIQKFTSRRKYYTELRAWKGLLVLSLDWIWEQKQGWLMKKAISESFQTCRDIQGHSISPRDANHIFLFKNLTFLQIFYSSYQAIFWGTAHRSWHPSDLTLSGLITTGLKIFPRATPSNCNSTEFSLPKANILWKK